jgi:putative ABC transport system permease protein
MMPDPRRFGVFFMSRTALAGLFDMNAAFNDVAVRTQRGANLRIIVDDLDRILQPYGGSGAYDRTDQVSHSFLDNELIQLRAMAAVIPPVFLFVAAFLVNMILSRLITLEREQIGLLKAIGFGPLAIAWHYAKLTLLIVAIGLAIGALSGNWMGRSLTRLYAEFFSFPFLIFRQSLDLYVIAGGVTVVAALAGAAHAIWSVVTLPAAVAMQPPAPTRYRTFFAGGAAYLRFLSQLTVMALRHLVRWPVRTLLTTIGTAMSVALLVTALFSFDSIDFMIDTIFFQVERQDATITFGQDLSPRAMAAIERLPGVMRAEPYRSTGVILRNGHRERRLAISTVPDGADLGRILDIDLKPVEPPAVGLLVSERVATLLALRVGDKVEVELLQKDHRIETVPVTAIVQSFVGLAVTMRSDALDRLLGDGPRVSGARISVDTSSLADLYRAVKETPAVASIALQDASRQRFRETIEQNITIMTTVYTALAIIITFGVVYNSARIQLSERARELASLRVFGFTRGEVSGVLDHRTGRHGTAGAAAGLAARLPVLVVGGERLRERPIPRSVRHQHVDLRLFQPRRRRRRGGVRADRAPTGRPSRPGQGPEDKGVVR